VNWKGALKTGGTHTEIRERGRLTKVSEVGGVSEARGVLEAGQGGAARWDLRKTLVAVVYGDPQKAA